ncbi:tyrosine-type recombinase/integrase [candidate division WOR-3 bacterium]|nr:tyrosine-type recombinase/integrase [candidate division WOR-3 bacterium]
MGKVGTAILSSRARAQVPSPRPEGPAADTSGQDSGASAGIRWSLKRKPSGMPYVDVTVGGVRSRVALDKLVVAYYRPSVSSARQRTRNARFEKAVELYLERCTFGIENRYGKPKSKNQAQTDQRVLGRRLMARFKGKQVGAITDRDLRQYLSDRSREPCPNTGSTPTVATINRETAVITSFFKFCVREGFAEVDPARDLKQKKEYNMRSHWFATEEELARWRAQLKGTPRDIFDVLIRTGLRVGECLALKPSSYDPLHNVLVIERPKEQRQAEVPVCEHVQDIIQSRMDGEWLFPCRDGRPYSVAGIRSIFKRARDRAGLRKFRLHDLRRTAATHMVKRGMNIRLVQAILRHKSLDVTARYVGIDRQDLQRAADALNDLGIGEAPAPPRARLF